MPPPGVAGGPERAHAHVIAVVAEARLADVVTELRRALPAALAQRDCAFLWGKVDSIPGAVPVTWAQGARSLGGLVTCAPDDVVERALPPSSGVLMGWHRGELMMAHGSDLSEASSFASFRGVARHDRAVRASYVMIVLDRNEPVSAQIALAQLAEITEVFGAAMLAI